MGAIKTAEQEIAGLNVYLAEPAQGTGGGMLLLPTLHSLSPNLRRYAAEIAAAGLTALAWDPFHGQDVAGLSMERLMALARTLSDPAALAEQTRLLDALVVDRGLQRVGVIGWCMGGRYALLLAARRPRLAACVAYHPTILRPLPAHHTEDAVVLAREIACPVQAIFPGGDQIVPREIYAALQEALEGREHGASIVQTYPGAAHAFMDQRDASEANRVATALAWPQTLAFIQASLAA
jgi:carboxymethylenebutenolidase